MADLVQLWNKKRSTPVKTLQNKEGDNRSICAGGRIQKRNWMLFVSVKVIAS